MKVEQVAAIELQPQVSRGTHSAPVLLSTAELDSYGGHVPARQGLLRPTADLLCPKRDHALFACAVLSHAIRLSQFVHVKSVEIIAVDHRPCLNWNSSTLAFPSSAHVITVPSVHLQEHSAAGCGACRAVSHQQNLPN